MSGLLLFIFILIHWQRNFFNITPSSLQISGFWDVRRPLSEPCILHALLKQKSSLWSCNFSYQILRGAKFSKQIIFLLFHFPITQTMFNPFLEPLLLSISRSDLCVWNWAKHGLILVPRKIMSRNLHQAIKFSLPIAPNTSLSSIISDQESHVSSSQCNGVLYDAFLVVPAVLFLVYLAVRAKKNLGKLRNRGSYIMISYYALLWIVSLLNLAWCILQVSLAPFEENSVCFIG